MKPSMELPLVLFTILSQTAVGITLLSGLRRWSLAGGAGEDDRRQWLAAAGLLALGLVASLFHLGHPLDSLAALKHLSSSWLSREALVFALLAGLMFLASRRGLPRGIVRLTVAGGLLGLFVQGMTYAPPSFPAINNVLPFAFFVVSAVTLGASAASLLAPEEARPALARVLALGLGAGLLVHLVAPCVWLSGGTVLRLTAQAYLSSPLYWAHILIGLALPLWVVARTGRTPGWLPLAILAGALCGRIVFYLETVHTAANMGGLY